MKRKICVITGSRADYGILYSTLKEIEQSKSLELQLVAAGMHYSERFGLTYKAIEDDGFKITAKVEMPLYNDRPVDVAKATGLATGRFAEAFLALRPDLILVVGDRFEIFAAVSAALFMRIPVAHIGGGDTTEGAFDEALRHGITKMSHLHFVTNPISEKRVRQLGEKPENIFNVGNPGLDLLFKIKLLNKEELERRLNLKFNEKIILVTFHPVTLENNTSEAQMNELLKALNEVSDRETTIIFTKSNADSDNFVINKKIDEFVSRNDRAFAFKSLGSEVYLSLLSICKVVVGNSSSGLLEAPSFKVPTVNIGDRQKGRLAGESVLHVEPKAEKIIKKINEALELDCSHVVNPYGSGNSGEKICRVLENQKDYSGLIKKHFYDI
jgi:UDP-N-acetylglucosamine 2-epimerase (non-hydrolysing)/GDP/UDP-N,N'-diacetylbacillosamine 2-epimerase (hydrolysing)